MSSFFLFPRRPREKPLHHENEAARFRSERRNRRFICIRHPPRFFPFPLYSVPRGTDCCDLLPCSPTYLSILPTLSYTSLPFLSQRDKLFLLSVLCCSLKKMAKSVAEIPRIERSDVLFVIDTGRLAHFTNSTTRNKECVT